MVSFLWLSLWTVISSIWHHCYLQLEQFNRDNNSYCLSNSFCLSPTLVVAKPFLAKEGSRAGISELLLSLLYFHRHRYFDFDKFAYLFYVFDCYFNYMLTYILCYGLLPWALLHVSVGLLQCALCDYPWQASRSYKMHCPKSSWLLLCNIPTLGILPVGFWMQIKVPKDWMRHLSSPWEWLNGVGESGWQPFPGLVLCLYGFKFCLF